MNTVSDAHCKGILPRIFEELCVRIGESRKKCELSMCFVEIYNDEILDLLGCRHGKKKINTVEGLTRIEGVE